MLVVMAIETELADPPALTGDLDDDAHEAGAFLLRGADLVGRLPARPGRSEAEQRDVDAIMRALDDVRERFLRRHTRALYAELTHNGTKAVRAEELVYLAAERVPGLTPARDVVSGERDRLQKDKDGWEVAQGRLLGHVLAHPETGPHLIEVMLRPTELAQERLEELTRTGRVDLGTAIVERHGRVGVAELRNPRHLNAEDDTTLGPYEAAIDLVLLDPEIEIGVLRGGVVEHPRYAGRRVFNAGVNLTHLYQGKISFVDFFLVRDLGLVNKLYRGNTGELFAPDEPEQTVEKPWIAAVEAFAIGGGCQILLTMDHVIAEQDAYFNLPARKEGIIPGAANLRLPRAVGDRLARQAILSERG